MKPHQLKAEKERRAKVKMRELARKIPNNEALVRILLGLEKPLRADFYRIVSKHVRFVPIRLEALNGQS